MRTDKRRLVWEDWLAIAIYFVFTIGLGLAVSITAFFTWTSGQKLIWLFDFKRLNDSLD
jgi:hypothetical protein